MKKYNIFPLFLSVLVLCAVCASKPAWGLFEGSLKWDDAVARCKGKGMRLPTRDELLAARETGANNSWDSNPTGMYWSSSRDGDEASYVLMGAGEVYSNDLDDPFYVRCIH